MKRLAKTQVAKKEQLGVKLGAAASALLVAQEAYDAAMVAYNEAAQEVNDFAAEVAEEARTYYNERSEKWQESAAGGDYDAWVQDWEDVQVELVDEIDGSVPTENPLIDLADAPGE
jgi:hypothetical protein